VNAGYPLFPQQQVLITTGDDPERRFPTADWRPDGWAMPATIAAPNCLICGTIK
jgi:hypothetical protein